MTYSMIPATHEHLYELAAFMRQADRDECIAQTGLHPSIALGMSVGGSEKSWAGLVGHDLLCIWGVSESDDDEKVGNPWMLATDLLVTHQRRFLKQCRGAVEEMQDMFPILENHVDARNTTAIRWLRWLGFDILEAEPHGPYKMPFHPFRRVRV